MNVFLVTFSSFVQLGHQVIRCGNQFVHLVSLIISCLIPCYLLAVRVMAVQWVHFDL